MKNQQSGFTLIELVVVIVILGILAAVAVPRFVDLSTEAEESALNATISAVESASAINFAACVVGNAGCIAVGGTGETDCGTIISATGLLQRGIDYTVAGGPINAGAFGTENTQCTVAGQPVSLIITGR